MLLLNNLGLNEPERERKVRLEIDGSKIVEHYGKIDNPNPKVSIQLKHKVEQARESMRTFATPFYNNGGSLDLGLTVSFDKVSNSYFENCTQGIPIPKAAMDAINFAALDVVNFVEAIISGGEFNDRLINFQTQHFSKCS